MRFLIERYCTMVTKSTNMLFLNHSFISQHISKKYLSTKMIPMRIIAWLTWIYMLTCQSKDTVLLTDKSNHTAGRTTIVESS